MSASSVLAVMPFVQARPTQQLVAAAAAAALATLAVVSSKMRWPLEPLSLIPFRILYPSLRALLHIKQARPLSRGEQSLAPLQRPARRDAERTVVSTPQRRGPCWVGVLGLGCRLGADPLRRAF